MDNIFLKKLLGIIVKNQDCFRKKLKCTLIFRKFGEITLKYIVLFTLYKVNTVAQWLRRCATNRKIADSFPDGVIGIFH